MVDIKSDSRQFLILAQCSFLHDATERKIKRRTKSDRLATGQDSMLDGRREATRFAQKTFFKGGKSERERERERRTRSEE